MDLSGFPFFPKLQILYPHLCSHLQGSCQERVPTLPASGTSNPDATEIVLNIKQGG